MTHNYRSYLGPNLRTCKSGLPPLSHCGTDDDQLRSAASKAQEINCINLHCTSLQLAKIWTQCLLQQRRFI